MAAEKPEDPLGSYPKRPRLGSEIVKMTGKPVSPEGEVSESLDRNNSDHKTSSTLSENISVTGAGELHQSTQQFPYSTSSSNTEPTEGPDPIPTVRPNVIISEEVPGTEDTSASWTPASRKKDQKSEDVASASSSQQEPPQLSQGEVEPHKQHEKRETEDEIDSDLDLGLGDLSPDPTPSAGPMGWLHQQMMTGVDPRNILARIIPPDISLPDDMSEIEMWSLIANYFEAFQEPERRKKLENFNTLDDVIALLRRCNKVIVLSGAGVSVSCGIPDFRSRDGIYARLSVDFPDLPDPQAMFDIHYFRKDPRPFFKFAKEIYPGQYKPSICHQFISLLEQHKKLLRNYSQNIDTLEQVAGISRVVQCHGSFATATCTNCGYKVDAEVIRKEIFNQVIPICPRCQPAAGVQAILKPDIVFFGEGLPNVFYDCLDDDKKAADLLIVIGSSLKVRPVATIPYPSVVPNSVPQILINREPLPHMNFDIELLGDGDVIINEICHRMGEGWDHVCSSPDLLSEITELPKQKSQGGGKSPLCQDHDKLDQSLDHVETKSGGREKPGTSRLMDDFESVGTPPALESCHDKSHFVKDLSRREDQVARVGEGTQQATAEKKTSANSPERKEGPSLGEAELLKSEQTADCSLDVSRKDTGSEKNGIETGSTENKCLLEEGDKGDNVKADICEADSEHKQAHEELSGNSAGDVSSKNSLVQSDEIGSSNSGTVTESSGSRTSKQRPRRQSVTEYMEASTYLFIPPNRYVFHGAEVYSSDDEVKNMEGTGILSPVSDTQEGARNIEIKSPSDNGRNSQNSCATSSSDGSLLSPQSEPEFTKGGMHQPLDTTSSGMQSSSSHGNHSSHVTSPTGNIGGSILLQIGDSINSEQFVPQMEHGRSKLQEKMEVATSSS